MRFIARGDNLPSGARAETSIALKNRAVVAELTSRERSCSK